MGDASAVQVDGGGPGASAIDALGPLFKLTEVHLWEDVSTATREPWLVTKSSKWPHCKDDISTASDSTSDFCYSAEDMELIEQMNALGLPVSFLTNKEKKGGNNRAKKKSPNMKDNSGFKEIERERHVLCKVSEEYDGSPSPFHDNHIPSGSLCSISMLGQSVSSYCDVAADAQKSFCCAAEGESASLTAGGHGIITEPFSVQFSGCQTASGNGQSLEADAISKREMQTNTELADLEAAHVVQFDPTEGSETQMPLNKEGSDASFFEQSHLDVNHEVIQACELAELMLHDEAAVNLSSEVPQNDKMASYICSGKYGEWRVYWDPFYQRNYYYNMKTEESTWSPPSDVEHDIFVECTSDFDGSTDQSDEFLAKLSETELSYASASQNDSIEDSRNFYLSTDQPVDKLLVDTEFDSCSTGCNMIRTTENSTCTNGDKLNEIDGTCNEENVMYMSNNKNISSMTNACTEVIPMETLDLDELGVECDSHVRRQKKRIRKKRGQRTYSGADRDLKFQLLEEISTSVEKYWYQRYLLFSRFDDGVRLDEEGWFSVTPEPIAKHHALRCGFDTIIDGFTGVGGNAIQFAKSAKHVIAIDIDPIKIDYAHHNAVIYEVDDRIDFVRGDFFLLSPKLKADTVFLSPPWGGPDYTKVKTYDIKTMLKPRDGYFLFEAAKKIAPKVVIFLPKNVDLNQLAELSLFSDPLWSLEVERNFLNGRLKAITAYFTNPEICTDHQ